MILRGLHIVSICRGILALYIVTLCLSLNAQEQKTKGLAIDVNIYNRYDDHSIDTTYMGNKEVFVMLDSLMRDTSIISHTQRINVVSSSSIEGRESYNRNLSQRRQKSVEATFRSRYDFIADSIWSFSYTPENWGSFRKAVVNNGNVPNREEVLSIIDMQECDADTKERLLKELDHGESWRYIQKHILPLGRGSVSMLFVPIGILPLGAPALMPIDSVEFPTTKLPILEHPDYSHPIISIRSNLLLDLTSTINISVEVPLAPHWSISAEYINPWWKSWGVGLTWEIESIYLDLRYWLGHRGEYNTLTGWSVGVYAGSGMYDIELFSDKGVQGEYTDFGATVSYAHSIGQGKHWLMEYTASLGYVTTHYRNYYTTDNSYEYGDIKVHNYPWSEETLRMPLPTRLGVKLCYLINATKRRGGVR